MDKQASNIIALILTSGLWTTEAALQRLMAALGKSRKNTRWPGRIVQAVFEQPAFAECPRLETLQEFLCNRSLQGIIKGSAKTSIERWVNAFSISDLPRPLMQPGNLAAMSWKVPPIVTSGELAEVVEIELKHLDCLVDRRQLEHSSEFEKLRNYRYCWVRKRLGGQRLLESPKQRLKQVQRNILNRILRHVPTHNAAHGFCSQRSTRTAAAVHTEQYVVLRIDLMDFFPSITAARVTGIFRSIGYPSRMANMLTGLCVNTAWKGVLDLLDAGGDWQELTKWMAPFFRPHLPQGAPTSPKLANLCAYSLDCRLSGLAEKFGGRYTRYADDLVFSGDRRFAASLKQFRVLALAIVIDEGFEIRKRKTKVMYSRDRQQVCGIVVNKLPNIARTDFELLKAMIWNCVRLGSDSQNRTGHANFRAHLEGRVAYVSSVNPGKGKQLRDLLKQVDWQS